MSRLRADTSPRRITADAVRAALIGAALLGLFVPAAAHAQAIRVRTELSVHADQHGIRVAARVRNESPIAATGMRLVLWPRRQPPVDRPAALAHGESFEHEWTIEPREWRDVYRQVAAVRVEYADRDGRRVSMVAAAAPAAGVTVTSPRWPDALAMSFTADEASRAVPVRIDWWTPLQLGVIGPGQWDPAAPLHVSLSPSSRIDGLDTSLVAILLPADGSAGSIVTVPIDAMHGTPLWQPPVLTLIAWCGVVLLATMWLAARRRTGRWSALVPGAVFVAGAGAVAWSLAPPELLTLTTTPGGGDYGSQYVAFDHLRRELLPHGVTYGWMPAHFAGLPVFLFYFPLAFWLGALLSVAAPATVAFKLATLAGPLMLPGAWFVSLGWLGAPRSSRWLAAAAAVVFLLNEAQQVWGGNLASVLAGEFAQGLGFPLAWLALAWTWSRRDEPSGGTRSAILLALTALAHAYAAVAAAAGVLLPLLDPHRWWPRLVKTAYAAAVSAALLAWWLLPLVWQLPWTTPSREQWPTPWLVAIPATTWPFVMAALAAAAPLLTRRSAPRVPPGLALVLVYAVAAFALSRLAYSLGLVNIRFLPMALGALLLAGAWQLGTWIERLAHTPRAVVLGGALVASLLLAVWPVSYLPGWIRWNMHGIEHAPGWRDYQGVMRLLGRDETGGRVFYEHNVDHDRLGTARAFEVLPVLAARPTLEGLYMQSALAAPATLLLQSELSVAPSCAVTSFECGQFAVDTGVAHARLLGARHIVAYSQRLIDALDASPRVTRLGQSGEYLVYRVHDAALAEAARYAPVHIAERNWRVPSHDWWRAASDLDVPLVFSSDATVGPPAVDTYRPGALPRQPLDAPPVVRATAHGGEIVIETGRPQHPVIVRVAYHPGWRADDGSRIELAAPGLMLVTPNSARVRITWSTGWIGPAGVLLSCATVLAAGFRRCRQWPARFADAWPPTSWHPWRHAWIGSAVAVTTIAAGWAWLSHPPVDAFARLADGQTHLAHQQFAAAEHAFADAMAGQLPARDDAAFYLGLVSASAGEIDIARRRWESFLTEFPVSTFRGETLVRLAALDRQRGDEDAAVRKLREALATPLTPDHWRAAALDALAVPD